MNNEKGSALTLVLLATIIFSILGLSILSAAVNGAKRATIQTENYQNNQAAISELGEIIAKIITEIEKRESDFKPENPNYNTNVNNLFASITDVTITDLTNDPEEGFGRNDTPNRAYKLTKTVIDEKGKEKTISRKLYLSSYPSFFNYAAGTNKGNMKMNGAVVINGNINANNLFVSNEANFIQGSGSDTELTTYPMISGNVYVNDTIFGYKNGTLSSISNLNHPDLPSYFYEPAPNIYPPREDFVDVNFDETFIKKINEVFNDDDVDFDVDFTGNIEEEADIQQFIKTIVSKNCSVAINNYQPVKDPSEVFNGNGCQNTNYYLIENDYNQSLFNDEAYSTPNLSGKKVILFTDAETITDPVTGLQSFNDVNRGVFMLSKSINLPDDAWLIVHGDLSIESYDTAIEIDGNILVTGNLIIKGNQIDNGPSSNPEDDEIYFNSTIYSLGTATINNTKILGKTVDGDKKQIVLLSKNNLLITRINEFRDIDTSIEPLEGYFYTNSDAQLYGVGSLFHIKGGLFARGGGTGINGLEINAVRGNVKLGSGHNLSFLSAETGESRFKIDYDEQIIIDQLDVLPVVDRIRVILDDYVFE